MKSWVLVSDNPYFAITDSKGNYNIDKIPAGTYEVICWQEKFKKKPLTATVKIGEGETKKISLFLGPNQKSKICSIKKKAKFSSLFFR